MKKILYLLLSALLFPSTLAVAQEDESGPESEWAALDRELRGLELILAERVPGPHLWGYLRTNLAFTDHEVYDGESVVGEYQAFTVDNLRVGVEGEAEGYQYLLSTEALHGTAQIQDAWVRVPVGDQFGLWMGRFRPPVLRSGMVDARNLLFITRTRNGVFYSARDLGVMVTGDHGRLHLSAAMQNGADAKSDRSLQTLAAKVNVIGDPELEWEGAYGCGRTTRFALGGAITNDDARGGSGEGTAFALEGYLVHRGLSLAAEWLSYETAYDLFPYEAVPGDQHEQRGNTQPWTITASYMVVPDKYEVAVRYDNFDDKQAPRDYGRETWTIGINRYIDGHDLKWQLNYADVVKNGAGDGPHEKMIALGLTLSF